MFGLLSASERESLREYLVDAMSIVARLSVSAARYETLLQTDAPPQSVTAVLYHAYRLVVWDQLAFEDTWLPKTPAMARKDYQIQSELIATIALFARFNHVAVRDNDEVAAAEASALRAAADERHTRAVAARLALGGKVEIDQREVSERLALAVAERIGATDDLLREAAQCELFFRMLLVWRAILEEEGVTDQSKKTDDLLFNIGLAALLADRRISQADEAARDELDVSNYTLAASVVVEEALDRYLGVVGVDTLTRVLGPISRVGFASIERFYDEYGDLDSRGDLVTAVARDVRSVCPEPEEADVAAALLFDEELAVSSRTNG